MNKQLSKIGLIGVVVLLIILMTSSLAWAKPISQERTPEAEMDVQASSSYIPVQGRLTDTSGNPLNGTYDLTYKLYEVNSGGTALCTKTASSVDVKNGLFNSYFSGAGCSIDGRQLYLGITVGSDAEMTPRMYIDNVPYAWTLHPGALIKAELGSNAILDIENTAIGGRGLRAYANSETGINYAVVGASRSPEGFGGYFYNTATGTALYASSDGIALQANGRIASSKPSYLWLSGNNIIKFNDNDATTFNLNSRGGVKIAGGGSLVALDVVLPFSIMGTQYGQNVKLTEIKIFWKGETEFDSIYLYRLRRQTGVCDSCYQTILNDTPTAGYSCDQNVAPNGCTITSSLTTNNVLSADSGILYLTFHLLYGGTTSWVEIDGVRLTLEYSD